MTYKTLKEKIAAEKQHRLARYAEYERLYREAWEAGTRAAIEAKPRPMVIMDGDGTPVDYVADGVCGFAWVRVPGNTSFARWLGKNNMASKAYPSGLSIWIGDYHQSYTRKSAHAYAMAQHLRANGIECSAGGRLD